MDKYTMGKINNGRSSDEPNFERKLENCIVNKIIVRNKIELNYIEFFTII